jgi:hypothetical protein
VWLDRVTSKDVARATEPARQIPPPANGLESPRSPRSPASHGAPSTHAPLCMLALARVWPLVVHRKARPRLSVTWKGSKSQKMPSGHRATIRRIGDVGRQTHAARHARQTVAAAGAFCYFLSHVMTASLFFTCEQQAPPATNDVISRSTVIDPFSTLPSHPLFTSILP